MPEIRRAERHKRPGVSYAVTDDGLELPVVDVTHAAFAGELTAAEQARLVARFLEEQQRFARLPAWLRSGMMRFFLRGSRIARGLREAEGTYLDSMTTYLFKLGPQMLGSYAVPVDRKILRSLPAISVRLRLRDMARLLADGLAPRLSQDARRPVCFINIAGGPAIDSINALIVLQRERPELLQSRTISLCVLDGDARGPSFGARALSALQEPGAALHGVDVRFEHRHYDWRNTAELTSALADAVQADAIVAASSEGGLFEYGTDQDIVRNLQALAAAPQARTFVVGSVTRDDETIRTLKLTSTAATKPRGLARFTELCAAAGWVIERSVERPLSDQVVLEPRA